MGIIEDLAADLEALLRAGRLEFPAKAEDASDAAGLLEAEIRSLNTQSALAGDPQVLRDALRICGDAHDGLRILVESLNYCSQGLIEMVDGYRQTDLEGAAAFELISPELTEGPPPAEADVPRNMGDPESPGDYSYPSLLPSTPQPEDPEDMLDEHDDELGSQPQPEQPEMPT
jgi:hypothetical protein